MNQLALLPDAVALPNEFHAGSGADGKHSWLTPPDRYARLDAEFRFDFDPCPYPLVPGFDGLVRPQGRGRGLRQRHRLNRRFL